MEQQKFSALDHLNPFKDMDYMRTLGASGPILLAQRNGVIRGAILGAMAGLTMDNTLGNGGVDLAIYLGMLLAVPDAIQGLGRGVMDVAKRMGNSSH